VIGLNIIIYITSQLKFVYLNNIGDYILVNFTAIPLTLIYYTIIRSDYSYKSQNEQTLQLEKLKSDHLDSELKLLKAQYHPHFLFNALNTVYFQVDEENNAAKKTIELLSDLLRYQLYDIDRMVSVGQEIDYMKTYISFQQLRMNERLVLNDHFDLASKERYIHPLLFQPLLENAFKYVGGEYWININLVSENNKIIFTVQNAISPIKQANKKNSGIGIENLKRRLELLYSKKHNLKIIQKEDTFFAELAIEL
jgi:LytS/YehU family sensor histidine kinase